MARARVMVVDDNEELRETVREALAREGHEVRGAEDGLAALALLGRFQPDVLILDVEMPRMSGRELVARLHRLYGEVLPFVVIVISSTANERTSPARWFLPKPFSVEALLQVVGDFCNTLRLRASAAT